jgi:hypothetical protein
VQFSPPVFGDNNWPNVLYASYSRAQHSTADEPRFLQSIDGAKPVIASLVRKLWQRFPQLVYCHRGRVFTVEPFQDLVSQPFIEHIPQSSRAIRTSSFSTEKMQASDLASWSTAHDI